MPSPRARGSGSEVTRRVMVLALVAGGALAATPIGVRAQVADADLAARAVAVGLGWSTGLIGVEFVVRSLPPAPRLGVAVGGGIVGPGGRVTVALLPPSGRLVPYAGAGVLSNLWGPRAGVGTDRLGDTRVIPVLEAGVQLWPARRLGLRRRGLYVDLGAGIAPGAPHDVWIMPRVLVGTAF